MGGNEIEVYIDSCARRYYRYHFFFPFMKVRQKKQRHFYLPCRNKDVIIVTVHISHRWYQIR